MVILHHIPDNQDAPFPCDVCGTIISPLDDYHICNEHLIIIYTNWEKALESGLQGYLDRRMIDV